MIMDAQKEKKREMERRRRIKRSGSGTFGFAKDRGKHRYDNDVRGTVRDPGITKQIYIYHNYVNYIVCIFYVFVQLEFKQDKAI